MMNKNVLTIATGKKLYIDLAVNLARSFRYWNRDNGIRFYFVTDNESLLPADIKDFINMILVEPGALGKGFSPKLHLDHLAPEGQTLFIDSDCLVYGDLTPVFEKFKGHEVSVIGSPIESGEWFGDIANICAQFQIPHLPKFNGGVYYLEKGATATAVYTKARDLEKRYDEIGFVRLRDRPNDEVLMALSMQLFNQAPIKEDGSVMAEFVNFQSGVSSDLLNGAAFLYNTPGHKNYHNYWPITEARPLIVHYLGFHNMIYPYIKEAKILSLLVKGYSKTTAKLVTLFAVTIPYKITTFAKNSFRPVYRLLFGYRPIARSERMVD